jgi:hypothetical protein
MWTTTSKSEMKSEIDEHSSVFDSSPEHATEADDISHLRPADPQLRSAHRRSTQSIRVQCCRLAKVLTGSARYLPTRNVLIHRTVAMLTRPAEKPGHSASPGPAVSGGKQLRHGRCAADGKFRRQLNVGNDAVRRGAGPRRGSPPSPATRDGPRNPRGALLVEKRLPHGTPSAPSWHRRLRRVLCRVDSCLDWRPWAEPADVGQMFVVIVTGARDLG